MLLLLVVLGVLYNTRGMRYGCTGFVSTNGLELQVRA